MFYGVIHEGYIFDNKDIEYQVEEFEQGKVKTLFVTGHSGSGKSTLGHKYEKELGINCYELDDIGWNYKFTDEQLKKYGPEIYEWFTGPGKKYRLDPKVMENNDPTKNPPANLVDWDLVVASTDFIKFILSKNARCVVEGIAIFQTLDEGLMKIEEFKNSAMIIKGTSAAKSTIRALKRDYTNDKKEDPNLKLKDALPFHYLVSRVKYALHDEGILREMRKKYRGK